MIVSQHNIANDADCANLFIDDNYLFWLHKICVNNLWTLNMHRLVSIEEMLIGICIYQDIDYRIEIISIHENRIQLGWMPTYLHDTQTPIIDNS